MKIIFATGNKGKMAEIREILRELPVSVLSMKEAGLDPEIEETGQTFLENARIKVRAIGPREDAIILADDSGIEIDAFGGEPGVHSARYLGEDTSYEIKNRTVLQRMAGIPESGRGCRYRCVIVALFPDGTESAVDGVLEGRISEAPAGEGGFGYDPIFYLPEYGRTTAELGSEAKNQISHRGKALRGILPCIRAWLSEHEDLSRIQ